MIITIDGPAGSGKSTVAKLLARKLNINFLNTGAMYRAVTYYLIENSISPYVDLEVKNALKKIEINFEGEEIFLCGINVTRKIRTPEVEKLVSIVSSIKAVREKMVDFQRKIVRGKNYVLEGRDTGSVVFPDADYKFYLYASLDERARRRQKEIFEKENRTISFDEVKKELANRDYLDENRELSPLKIPHGAIVIDTTDLSIDEVLAKILSCINNKSF
jgi:cytidylate kinase